MKECGRVWDFGHEKGLNAVSRDEWGILVGQWEIVMLTVTQTMDSQLKRFQRRTIFATRLEIILGCFGEDYS